uniref:Uncharacterized protein n=1 Tax=Spongospora subterranea TaxID=70186 RepID=A0A0H5QSD7_9EUKA|eukprot:CRZ04880.1 hypothetical protein [Spongospora subterranea]
MEDVVDDIPEVVTFMECFLVRAIFDEVLPPSFATRSLMGLVCFVVRTIESLYVYRSCLMDAFFALSVPVLRLVLFLASNAFLSTNRIRLINMLILFDLSF